jgi:hypothetical protein
MSLLHKTPRVGSLQTSLKNGTEDTFKDTRNKFLSEYLDSVVTMKDRIFAGSLLAIRFNESVIAAAITTINTGSFVPSFLQNSDSVVELNKVQSCFATRFVFVNMTSEVREVTKGKGKCKDKGVLVLSFN